MELPEEYSVDLDSDRQLAWNRRQVIETMTIEQAEADRALSEIAAVVEKHKAVLAIATERNARAVRWGSTKVKM